MNNENLENLIIKKLKEEKSKTEPPKEILSKIIFQIKERENGRTPSIINVITSQIHDIMTNNKKWIYSLAGVAIVVLFIVAFSQYGAPDSQIAQNQENNEQFSLIPATGNVDDLTEELMRDVLAEQADLEKELNEISLLAADVPGIADFGQSYDENTF